MPNDFLPDDIRHVWQNQLVENTPMPLEEIRRQARQFERRISRRNLREYAAAALGIAAFTFYIFLFHSPMVRAGSTLSQRALPRVSVHGIAPPLRLSRQSASCCSRPSG